ncbi:hypothetical protein CDCA_CDCA10G3087 [Cyanidium caldarium]|uniref:Uncharacterized protein n=1 Tax=Cyanidium caldarium TaxID=2771 RepID=A0AAV9IXK2_CYACA|nr:hypothetical protein CDCA_CDCA10G3087 [Cyanidium caldarium]
MVLWQLQTQWEWDGIASLQFPEEHDWHIFIKCIQCGEEGQRAVVVSPQLVEEGIRGAVVHLRYTCWFCRRQHEIALRSTGANLGGEAMYEWKNVVSLDCRGVEPIDWRPDMGGALRAAGEGGYEFDEVALDAEDANTDQVAAWYDYDEQQQREVSVILQRYRWARESG